VDLNAQLADEVDSRRLRTMIMTGIQYTIAIIGATGLRDPWDASPPTSEIWGTNCIWSPPSFVTGCHYFASRTYQLKLLGEKECRVEKGMDIRGWSNNGRRGSGGAEKGRGITHHHHPPPPEVPCNFSTVVASTIAMLC